jgi:hypothetical protein
VQLDPKGEWSTDVDLLLIPGPFYPLSPVISRISGLKEKRKIKIAIWLTEQRLSNKTPDWFLRWGGDFLRTITANLENLSYQQTVIKYFLNKIVLKGTRLRLPGEISLLYKKGWLDLLAVSTLSHQHFFQKKLGITTEVIPMGYHKYLGENLHLNKDIDVVFLGSLRDHRRKKIINKLYNSLAERNITLVIHDGSCLERKLIFGQERTNLLNRSKIMLNIMRQPWDDLVFRMLLAAPNRTMIVSEPVIDTIPFQPENHFIMAEIEQISRIIQCSLQNHEKREQIIDRSYDLVVNKMPMEKMILKLMKSIRKLS